MWSQKGIPDFKSRWYSNCQNSGMDNVKLIIQMKISTIALLGFSKSNFLKSIIAKYLARQRLINHYVPYRLPTYYKLRM